MTLGELALSANWSFGLVLDEQQITDQAVNAARQYCAWTDIKSLSAATGIPQLEQLDAYTDISDSEWGIIRPLFMLYIERDNARALEASRMNGVDVYGRDMGSIENDIRQYETVDLPRLSFSCSPETV